MLVLDRNTEIKTEKKGWLQDDSIKKALLSKSIAFHIHDPEIQEKFLLLKNRCKKPKPYGFNIRMNPDLGEWIINNAYELSKLFEKAQTLGEDPLDWTKKRIIEMVKQIEPMNLDEIKQRNIEKTQEIDAKSSVLNYQ